MLKIAFIADIHHGPVSNTKQGPAALSLLEAFLASEEVKHADLVVDLGDRISDVDLDTDLEHLEQVAGWFRQLEIPRVHLLGNHDLEHLTPEQNAERLGAPTTHQVLELKGFRVVVWQALPHLKPHGFNLQQEDLDWLQNTLGASDLPTIVCTHVPLDQGNSTGNFYFEHNPEVALNSNGHLAREILTRHGHVVLCVAGHQHWNRVHTVDGVQFLTLQSLTETFTTGAQPAGSWAGLQVDRDLQWTVQGLDPFACTLPLRGVGTRWARLPRFVREPGVVLG